MSSFKRLRLLRLTRLVPIVIVGALTVIPVNAAFPPGNVVQQWNKIAEDAVVGAGAFQNEGLVYMAYESAAVYDAVVAIEGGYEGYGPSVAAAPGASVEAAVVEAAYTTLRYYFPAQAAVLDALHDEALLLIPDGHAKQDGRAVGRAAAESIIVLRQQDGRLTPIGVTSMFALKPPRSGIWRLTPPAYAPPQTPWVGSVQPFVLNASDQFHPAPPPPLTSQQWVREFDEMKTFGSNSSRARNDEQTTVARFWTANVIRQYNLLGRNLSTDHALDLLQTARLLAMINIVGADAQISVMHWKYHFLFWRPVTAIDPSSVIADGMGPVPGFTDDNSRTVEEAGWRPLIATPNHPEYPAAHGSLTSAVAEVLTEFLETEEINIDIAGFDATGAPGNLNAIRHFDTADQLRQEIIEARLWAGLHYRGSSEAGVDLGRKVAHYDLDHAFREAR